MLPNEIAKSNTEHAHQAAFFAWVWKAASHGIESANKWSIVGSEGLRECVPDWRFEWVFAIPNGGSRGGNPLGRRIEGARLKAEGVMSGVADIFVPYAVRGSYGLFIEMKKPELKKENREDNGATKQQLEFLSAMRYRDYATEIAYSWHEARDYLCGYITGHRK